MESKENQRDGGVRRIPPNVAGYEDGIRSHKSGKTGAFWELKR